MTHQQRQRRFDLAPATMIVLLGAAIAIAGVGCHNTRACKQGTVFLNLRLGEFSDADKLTVDVTVEGGTPKQRILTLAGGVSGGGIEVDFPSGYPAGQSVTVVVSASKGATPLGSRTITKVLPTGCASYDIDFGGRDAGAEASTATGGAGGTVGAGGANASGGAAGGGAGGGGRGGNGGVVATGGAGAAGTGGAGGGTGGRGSGGTIATGGTVGSGGSAGSTDGGVDRGCVPTSQTEQNCFNNIDDDCNGLIDCADTACSPTYSQCEPLDSALGMIGASIQANAACPAEAPNAHNLMSGLVPGTTCTGCSCATGTSGLLCSADLSAYYMPNDSTCAANVGGQPVITLASNQGCVIPNWAAPLGSIYGIRSAVFQGRPTGTCAPTGTPIVAPPAWGTTTKFCGLPSVGGGCPTGAVCVPRSVGAAGPCLLMDGARTCPAGLRQSAWFTGYSDARTCSTCSCGSPTGGDCGSMLIAVGSDSVCTAQPTGYVRNGSATCFSATGVYFPGLSFVGSPIAPTCAAASTASGTVATTGPQTLCCI